MPFQKKIVFKYLLVSISQKTVTTPCIIIAPHSSPSLPHPWPISSSPPPFLQVRQLIFRKLGNLLKSRPRNSKAQKPKSTLLTPEASVLFKISCFEHALFFFFKHCEFPPFGFKVFYRDLCHYRVSEYIFAKLVAMKLHSHKGLADPHTNIYSVSIFSQIHRPLYRWSVVHFKSLHKQV